MLTRPCHTRQPRNYTRTFPIDFGRLSAQVRVSVATPRWRTKSTSTDPPPCIQLAYGLFCLTLSSLALPCPSAINSPPPPLPHRDSANSSVAPVSPAGRLRIYGHLPSPNRAADLGFEFSAKFYPYYHPSLLSLGPPSKFRSLGTHE